MIQSRRRVWFLVVVTLFVALSGSGWLPGRAAAQQSSPQGRPKKRVYTNDDFAVSTAPPPAASNPEPDKPVAGPSGGERVAPFVPTPMDAVDKMLEVAGVSEKDVVYDLGSGDGRIVLRAAEKYHAKAVGVELDHGLAVESLEKAKELKLDKLATIIEGDLFKTDFRPATVVTIYLLLNANDRLRPLLEKDLRPGTRVVAHDIRIPGWNAESEESFNVGNVQHTVYLYLIPSAFKKKAAPAP
jgi:SAM-dependent methyltransferase